MAYSYAHYRTAIEEQYAAIAEASRSFGTRHAHVIIPDIANDESDGEEVKTAALPLFVWLDVLTDNGCIVVSTNDVFALGKILVHLLFKLPPLPPA